MKKTALTFGLISGAISSLILFVLTPFADRIGFGKGEIIGYTAIVLSFLLVFFGIRSYREEVGGTISFGQAFKVGILITLISCVCYVIAWEIFYYNFMPDFVEKYATYIIAQLKASGASQELINQKTQQLQQYKKMLDNPLLNAAITFTEPFPVGLIITLISAGILSKRRRGTRSYI